MSEKSKLSSGRHVDPQRRKLLKLSAAAGASAIASPWMFQSSRAAPRPVKIGMVSPETGPIAAFGEADQFVLAGVRKALGDGIAIAGEKHPVEIIYKDSQSNPNRAAEVTAQLINNDKVDIVIGSSTSDTVIPVADQCELAGVPCVTLRASTEWVETVQTGWNVLVDLDKDRAVASLERPIPKDRPELYGDGKAAERCVAAIGSLTRGDCIGEVLR